MNTKKMCSNDCSFVRFTGWKPNKSTEKGLKPETLQVGSAMLEWEEQLGRNEEGRSVTLIVPMESVYLGRHWWAGPSFSALFIYQSFLSFYLEYLRVSGIP